MRLFIYPINGEFIMYAWSHQIFSRAYLKFGYLFNLEAESFIDIESLAP